VVVPGFDIFSVIENRGKMPLLLRHRGKFENSGGFRLR
jgi:hypothetical protein